MRPTELRALIRQNAWCLACGAKPAEFDSYANPIAAESLHVFVCHGSRQVVTVVDTDSLVRVLDKVANLFEFDAYPDMRELLRYNREPWSWK